VCPSDARQAPLPRSRGAAATAIAAPRRVLLRHAAAAAARRQLARRGGSERRCGVAPLAGAAGRARGRRHART
jgi:hypothetical protein